MSWMRKAYTFPPRLTAYNPDQFLLVGGIYCTRAARAFRLRYVAARCEQVVTPDANLRLVVFRSTTTYAAGGPAQNDALAAAMFDSEAAPNIIFPYQDRQTWIFDAEYAYTPVFESRDIIFSAAFNSRRGVRRGWPVEVASRLSFTFGTGHYFVVASRTGATARVIVSVEFDVQL